MATHPLPGSLRRALWTCALGAALVFAAPAVAGAASVEQSGTEIPVPAPGGEVNALRVVAATGPDGVTVTEAAPAGPPLTTTTCVQVGPREVRCDTLMTGLVMDLGGGNDHVRA